MLAHFLCEDHRPYETPQDERTLPPQMHNHGKLKEMGDVWLGLGLGR